MNIVEGLSSFMARKNYKNNQLSKVLGCSDSTVSLYLSGKSGLSLEKLGALLKDGMTLEEAFGEEVAAAIKKNIAKSMQNSNETNSLSVVVDGLQRILDVVKQTM